MSEESDQNADQARDQAVQAVVDRVSSYQESAAEGTLERELRSALDEAGLELSDEEIATRVAEIEGRPDASADPDVVG